MPGTKTVKNEELFADVEQIIGEGGRIRLRVKGYSMRPFLRNGTDCVNLSPIGLHRPERGMVVLFRYRGRHILHRICRIDAEEAVIEGDGNYRQRNASAPATSRHTSTPSSATDVTSTTVRSAGISSRPGASQ